MVCCFFPGYDECPFVFKRPICFASTHNGIVFCISCELLEYSSAVLLGSFLLDMPHSLDWGLMAQLFCFFNIT